MKRRRMSQAEVDELAVRKHDRWQRAPGHRNLQGRRAAIRPRTPAPSETSECRTFIAWTRLVSFAGAPLFERVVKVANERGKAGPMTAILEAIGMRKGFHDYIVFAPFGSYHGLVLEAKRTRDYSIEPEQKAWTVKLAAWGYHAQICIGAAQLIDCTKKYMLLSGATAAGAFIDRTRLSA